MRRRAFVTGALGFLSGVACSDPVVRRAPAGPIGPDPRGGILVVIAPARTRGGVIRVASVPIAGGAAARPILLGACVASTHFVALVPPGPQLLIAYDDDDYDGAEAMIAPGAIYAVATDRDEGDLELRPLLPGEHSVRRLLDETDRVELARAPKKREVEAFERKVRLGRIRYAEYSAKKRAARAIGPAHAWR